MTGSALAGRRTATIDAFIDLVIETGGSPRPESVARRAGISIASLYRYFDNLDELRRDAFDRVLDRFPDLFHIPDVGGGGRDQRIDVFVSTRLALHERLHALQLLGRAASRRVAGLADHVHNTRRAAADQLSLHFATDLAALDPNEREAATASINALTAVESWEHFRHSLGRTTEQTHQAWQAAIDRLLSPTEEPK